ncbi:MAG: hypothetical protein C0430_04570, partial [Flavobacterium sp.]|nr:hypothetical protein [Flavobacterium sp.]
DGVHPSGLHSIGLRLRLGERIAPFQGHSPSPACTHSASEQAPLGTTNKPEPVTGNLVQKITEQL